MTPMPTLALVPRFHPDRLMGDPQAWQVAMDRLAHQVQAMDEDAVTAVAAPEAWLEAHGGILAETLKSGRLMACPWLLWPAPWGLTREALVRLGVVETGPFPCTWRDCVPSDARWIDVTCPLPDEEWGWVVRPVQSAVQSIAGEEPPAWPGPVRRLTATLLAVPNGESNRLVQQVWQRLKGWTDNVDGVWLSPTVRWESLDALWKAARTLIPVPARPVQNQNATRMARGKTVLEGGAFCLEVSEGGRVDLVHLSDGQRLSRFLEYRLEGPTATTESRGQPHRIAIPQEEPGLRLRVRLPLPGKAHGLRDPLKLWTTLCPNEPDGLAIQTRFENLPEGHRLVMILKTGLPVRQSLNRGPWGDVAVSGGAPCGTVVQFKKNGSQFSMETLDWQSYQAEANGRVALSHVHGEKGTFDCQIRWIKTET